MRTRGGRWTFPKGSVESGLTHAQAAALEAFEEAGVHGRIEEAAFARYVRIKPGRDRARVTLRSSSMPTSAKCRVSQYQKKRIESLPGFPRKRRSVVCAKSAPRITADDLARIVDRAVARIQRLYRGEYGRARVARREVIEIDNARIGEQWKVGEKETLLSQFLCPENQPRRRVISLRLHPEGRRDGSETQIADHYVRDRSRDAP